METLEVQRVEDVGIDIRTFQVEVRETKKGIPSIIEGRVLVYGVTDAYGTRWKKGSITKSVENRLPPILWAHKPDLPIGRAIDFSDHNKYFKLIWQLDDPDYVPMARQAAYQLQNGTIDEFSIGFVRKNWKELDIKKSGGAYEEMLEADVVETSVVPFGAVPGTGIVGMRALFTASGVKMYVPARDRIEVLTANPREEPQTPQTAPETPESNPVVVPSSAPTIDPNDPPEPNGDDVEPQEPGNAPVVDDPVTTPDTPDTIHEPRKLDNDDSDSSTEPRTKIIDVPLPGTLPGATFQRKDGKSEPIKLTLSTKPSPVSPILRERIAARKAKQERAEELRRIQEEKKQQAEREARAAQMAQSGLAVLRSRFNAPIV